VGVYHATSIITPDNPFWRRTILVQFPSEISPRGNDVWFLLDDLEPGARYEVRICWAATTPTDFWLSVHSQHEQAILLNSNGRNESRYSKIPIEDSSHLYLKISGAASFFTTDTKLMDDPPPVLVDIILDEYLFGVLPLSLRSVALFITVMAVASYYLGIWFIKFINGLTKPAVKEKKG